MKTTRIKIKNLFGIKEISLDGKSVEITGPKGMGKTSVLDSIRYALTNRSDRDFIVKQGEDEGEILIETDTGLNINRKARTDRESYIKVKHGEATHTRAAEFLKGIFTPLQLNPIEFTQMSKQEKNRVILNLIEFQWDLDWIKEKFGEIPAGVSYERHILQVLEDIQSKEGVYFQTRQDTNREIRNQKAVAEEIALSLPDNYQFEKWNKFDMSTKYRELEKIRVNNSRIEKAKAFADAYQNKLRGLEAQREIDKSTAEKTVAEEKSQLKSTIERLKAEIIAAEDKLLGLDEKLDSKIKLAESQFETAKAKLDADTEVSQEWADKEIIDISELQEEINTAEEMRKHLNEYERMVRKLEEAEILTAKSEELTRKIEIARELPGEILRTAKIPINGLTVENGTPLIKGLPISNLSDGELLELCVDVTIQKPGGLEIILLDGAERLDSENRKKLYAKCKEKGLQLIATRVTDSDELEVTEL